MNLLATTSASLAEAGGRLDLWFAGMRGPEGYYGPVVGPRGAAMAYCGPGFDWRYEGLLEGWMSRHRAAPEAAWLDRIEGALAEIGRAQLANGAFRCSYFDSNPFEGGMPYEPILVAALLRARAFLKENGRTPDPALDRLAEQFVEGRLFLELWNKALRTFNNWLQSEYDSCSPAGVAAIVEVLIAYGEATGSRERMEPYIRGAAESLLAAQVKGGALAGAMPVSSRPGAPANALLAARCLPALALLTRCLNDDRFKQAGEAVEGFLRSQALSEGGFAAMAYDNRPAAQAPVFVGAAAGVLTSLARSGRSPDETWAPHVEFILRRQTATGAFDNAAGFGGRAGEAEPDWRDVVPACGWADKIYQLVALLHPKAAGPAVVGEVRRAVRVRGRRAFFEESSRSMRLVEQTGRVWFDWEKGTKWPRTCLL